MSIITADPKGRLVFIKPTPRTVITIRRDLLISIHVEVSPPTLHLETDGDSYSVRIAGAKTTRQVDDDALELIYQSVISEDTDVIWTQDAVGAWTRTPDKV